MFALTALKKLCALLEQETGVRVYRGRQVIGADVTLPCIIINETIRAGNSNTGADEGKTIRNDRVDFLLSGYVDVKMLNTPSTWPMSRLLKLSRHSIKSTPLTAVVSVVLSTKSGIISAA